MYFQARDSVETQALQAEVQRLSTILETKEQEEKASLEWQDSLQEMVAESMVRLEALEQGAGPQVFQLPPERNMMQLDGGRTGLPPFMIPRPCLQG